MGMLTDPYVQRALAAAVILAPLCALLGVFVTARRMAFFSDAVSHSALAGVALGYALGAAEPTIPMLAMGLAVAAATLWLKEKTELLSDTILALLLSGSVALGLILLSLLKASRSDIHQFLFGDILAVGFTELLLGGLTLAVVVACTLAFFSPLALMTAHEELAQVAGVPVRRYNYVFVVFLTVTVAVSIRLLGIMLVTSLLVIPPAAARNLSRNLRQHVVLSAVFGAVGGVGGVVAAYVLDVPCGPAIVLCAIALFAGSLPLRHGRNR